MLGFFCMFLSFGLRCSFLFLFLSTFFGLVLWTFWLYHSAWSAMMNGCWLRLLVEGGVVRGCSADCA